LLSQFVAKAITICCKTYHNLLQNLSQFVALRFLTVIYIYKL